MPAARASALFVLFASYCATGAGCSSSSGAHGASGGASGLASTGGASTANGGSAPSNGGTPGAGAMTAGGHSGGVVGGSGMPSTGGVSSMGGTPSGGASAGGATGAGGTPSTSTCAPATKTACTAPMVRITEIDVGAPVVVNADDAALKMLSLSPVPSGGTRLAWMSNDANVHVTNLDCDDHVVDGFTLPAKDYGDIYADDKGGVLLVSRDAQGGGTLNCGAPTNLCGTPPSPAIPCYDMYMVRFDGKTETWATKLTTSSAALPPYSTGPMGPQTYFIWWYAHHGRLASDGTNFAAYYGAATSVSQACTTGGNTAINIHQGDEMRVVSPSGMMLSGHNSFVWGCSHSGFEKIVWDQAANRFEMVCRSDGFPHAGLNVNAMNLVSSINTTMSSVSNLVVSSVANNYWVLVSDMGTLHLLRFTSAGGTAADLNLGSGDSPHLVKYGGHIFGTWTTGSGGNMTGQVFDAGTGAAIGSPVAIAAASNVFQDFRDYPDGSAAYAAPGSGSTKVKIVRVMPCMD